MIKRRKFYYSLARLDGGMSYTKAVSRDAAARQVKKAAKASCYVYLLKTLKRITKTEYDRVHRKHS